MKIKDQLIRDLNEVFADSDGEISRKALELAVPMLLKSGTVLVVKNKSTSYKLKLKYNLVVGSVRIINTFESKPYLVLGTKSKKALYYNDMTIPLTGCSNNMLKELYRRIMACEDSIKQGIGEYAFSHEYDI